MTAAPLHSPRATLSRFIRSETVRWAVLAALAPLLLLGGLGGATVLAHRHDGGGLHLHSPCPDAGGSHPGLGGAPGHRHCDAGEPEGVDHDRDTQRPCEGSLLTLPDHAIVASRGVSVPRPVLVADDRVAIAPDLTAPAHTGPGRAPRGADRRPRRARDHLLRTSRALLL